MRLLNLEERIALIEIDHNDGRCIPDHVFTDLAKLDYGYWGICPEEECERCWFVTPKGRLALLLDTIAKNIS